jgi:hypothetical protein
MACASPLDLKIKGALIRDVFNLIGLVSNESRDSISKYERNPSKTSINSIFNTSKSKFDFNKPITRPSSALKPKEKEIKEKTSNWSRFNDILQADFNIDPDTLSKEDKYLCKEF